MLYGHLINASRETSLGFCPFDLYFAFDIIHNALINCKYVNGGFLQLACDTNKPNASPTLTIAIPNRSLVGGATLKAIESAGAAAPGPILARRISRAGSRGENIISGSEPFLIFRLHYTYYKRLGWRILSRTLLMPGY